MVVSMSCATGQRYQDQTRVVSTFGNMLSAHRSSAMDAKKGDDPIRPSPVFPLLGRNELASNIEVDDGDPALGLRRLGRATDLLLCARCDERKFEHRLWSEGLTADSWVFFRLGSSHGNLP